MSWHIFAVSVDVDSDDAPEGRVDRDLFDQLVEREMWDRALEACSAIVGRHLDQPDKSNLSEEFEVFDLYDESVLLAVRFSSALDIWELFETVMDDEVVIEDEDTGDSAPE